MSVSVCEGERDRSNKSDACGARFVFTADKTFSFKASHTVILTEPSKKLSYVGLLLNVAHI